MKTLSPPKGKLSKWIVFYFLFAFFQNIQAQNPVLKVYEDWNTVSGTQNMFQRSVTRSVPGTSNVVIAGATINSNGDYDIFVQKINGSGTVLWSAQYNGVGNGDDVATDIRVATNGEIYVCGTYYKDATDSSNAIVIKYSPNGNQRWTSVYNGSGSRNDGYSSLLVSGANVYAVGACWSTSNQYDMLTKRLDTAGTSLFTTTADNAGLADGAVSLSARSGSLFVVGGVQSSSTAYKIATWKINPLTGAIITTTLSSNSSIAIDRVNDVQENSSGEVYVAGTVYDVATGFDYKLFKYDVNLSLLWSATWNGAANLNDGVTGLAIDQYGSVIITGYTGTAQGNDFATVKYSNAGVLQWATTFDGGGSDSASCIVVNSTDTNKIYVSGYSYNGSTNDYHTIRYNGAGTEIWNVNFNSLQNGNDLATAIALDTLGSVIVTGQNQISPTSRIYTTVKYLEKSTMLPQDTVAATSSSFVFTENRGQLFGSDSLPHPEIKFYTIHGTPNVYFADTSVSYVIGKPDTSSSHLDSLKRVDMKYVGANSGLRIRSMEQRSEINNFYYSHISGGRENVHDYNQLVEFSVWNGVDIIYGSNLKGLKYYFVCKPVGGGGTAYQIDLKYEGADSVKVGASGELIIYTRFGNVVQPKAAAWQLDASGNYTSLGWQPSYNIVATNEVQFNGFGSYNTAYPLVIAIDRGSFNSVSIQNLDWSTYYGGYYRDNFVDVDVRQTDGSTYYCGTTQSSDFPIFLAYQPTISGADDAVAVRFDSTGHRIYSTFYGTSPFSSAPQLAFVGAVAANGNYFIGGRTYKVGTVNIAFPTTQPAGAYVDTSFGGGFGATDAFIAAFNPTGQLYWSTYYGGNTTSFPFFEEVYDMTFDANGNLYAVMRADTATPRMVETGAYNDASLRGGMILKFDANLARKWATMFSTKDGLTSRIAFDVSGNYYVVGTAKDSLLPLRDPGGLAYMDTTFNGITDAYIAKFNSSDSLVWCTYFGGAALESAGAVKSFNGELYVAGTTTSLDLPFLYLGVDYIDSTLNGSNDMFIGHFKSTGDQVWTTYCGGSGTEQQGNFAQDQINNIYFSGITTSSDFPVVNAPFIYYDSVYGGTGINDVILMSFDPVDQLKWSSYFGGVWNETTGQGLGIYQNSNKLYVCGEVSTPSTGNPNFPTEDLGGGAYWQPLLGGVNENAQHNAFISRFELSPFINVGIDEEHLISSNNSALFVYPNPSDGEFQVVINSTSKSRKIEVYNTLGQMIQSVNLEDGAESQTISLNLREEATGIYFIVLKDDNGVYSRKIIKQ